MMILFIIKLILWWLKFFYKLYLGHSLLKYGLVHLHKKQPLIILTSLFCFQQARIIITFYINFDGSN
jgi:hypothetical protein